MSTNHATAHGSTIDELRNAGAHRLVTLTAELGLGMGVDRIDQPRAVITSSDRDPQP